jgi:acylglycerol lipase
MARLDVERLRAEFTGPHEVVRASDGQRLFLRRWEAAGESPVSLLVLHGITAHSGPYGPLLAEPLARAGVTVFGMDLRGHGLSDGVRGDYPGPERFASDLAETVAYVKARSKKLVVLGHSLGTLSAVVAQRQRPRDVDGVILLSVGNRIRAERYERPTAGAALRGLLGVALLPGSPLIEYRRVGMLGLDDPLYNFRYSARFYTVLYGIPAGRLLRMMRAGSLDSPNLRFDPRLRVPLLVAVGDQDELFPADSARALCDALDADDKEFLVIPGGRHAVFPKEAPEMLEAWLSRKFGTGPEPEGEARRGLSGAGAAEGGGPAPT